MEPVRLQKFLARAGVASRRASEELIASGRVSVNGEVVREMGTKIDPACAVVELDGARVTLPEEQVVLMLNKPAGYLSAMSDAHDGRCVSELVPTKRFAGLFPVGRLDKDTTGLLLFTNDGELGNALIHPRHHAPKTYRALVSGQVGERALETLRSGVVLEDGLTQPAEVELLERQPKHTLLEITIYEGRNRQIRRMCAEVGLKVVRLKRTCEAGLSLGTLAPGKWRRLTDSEISLIKGEVR